MESIRKNFDNFVKNDPDLKDDPEFRKKVNEYGKVRIVYYSTGVVVYNAINFWDTHINMLQKYKGTSFEKEVKKQLNS
jgi:hypothetical protein